MEFPKTEGSCIADFGNTHCKKPISQWKSTGIFQCFKEFFSIFVAEHARGVIGAQIQRAQLFTGKTVQVNYFLVDNAYFVDLPGYGYAKVSGAEKERWAVLMEDYFAESERISLGVLIVDARHTPTDDDVMMSDYFWNAGQPFCVVANKSDKLKKSEIEERLADIRETLHLPDGFPLILFSAEKGGGRGELLRLIEENV